MPNFVSGYHSPSVRPWFGAWPPVATPGGRMSQDDKPSFFEKYRLRLELVGLIFLGVIGSVLWSHSASFPIQLLEHLFMAVAISALIAFFIELALHRQLARNVFEASIGYLLQPELRSELRWIYGFDFLCEDHTQTVRIIPRQDGLVTVRCEVSREFKNISDEIKKFPVGLSTDEWLHAEPSRIISYECFLNKEKVGGNFAESLEPDPNGVGVRIVQRKENSINVPGGSRIKAAYVFEETHHKCDLIWTHFGNPTVNATIVVIAPDEFVTNVIFSHRDADPKLVRDNENTWKLKAALLPYQSIRIYWHPKQEYEEWKRKLQSANAAISSSDQT